MSVFSFIYNDEEYVGTIVSSAGATAAGFHIDITSPITCRTISYKTYSTHDGKLFDGDIKDLYHKLMIEKVAEVRNNAKQSLQSNI